MENKIQKISFWRMLGYFIIYSFLGYIVETLFALINYNVLESRKSFLYGPFCGIYGLGAVILILVLRYFKKNNYTLFFGGCLTGAIIEYFVSLIGELVFDARWWDYSEKFLNVEGRICLLYSIFWGILSLLLVRVINPQVDKFIDFLKTKIHKKLIGVLISIGMIFMIFNIVSSSVAMHLFLMRVAVENNLDVPNKENTIKEYNKIYGNSKKAELIKKYWGNEKMIKTYPNVTIKLANNEILWVKDFYPEIKTYLLRF